MFSILSRLGSVKTTNFRKFTESYRFYFKFPTLDIIRHTKLKFQETTNSSFIKVFATRNIISNHARRIHSGRSPEQAVKNRNVVYYCTAFVMLVGGFTYSSVFLYRLYCQSTGKGGRAFVQDVGEIVEKMTPNKKRLITVMFNADLNSRMVWNFKPQQSHIKVSPGETALAFYSAENPTDRPVCGVATYNVLPYEAGRYFNKIQCFCFEEQQLNPHEEVDLPVFFYLDPEYAEDPRLENIDDIVLSYTFFEAKDGLQLPMPTFS